MIVNQCQLGTDVDAARGMSNVVAQLQGVSMLTEGEGICFVTGLGERLGGVQGVHPRKGLHRTTPLLLKRVSRSLELPNLTCCRRVIESSELMIEAEESVL
ncbi:MAG UNVERIFIED_CONTAM: hypothetical protein LVT10_25965 [Anaerolineae bacterium]|jgi:hypothetical protein